MFMNKYRNSNPNHKNEKALLKIGIVKTTLLKTFYMTNDDDLNQLFKSSCHSLLIQKEDCS